MGFRHWLRGSVVIVCGAALSGCQNPTPRSTYVPPASQPLAQQQGRTPPPPAWPAAGSTQTPGQQYTMPTSAGVPGGIAPSTTKTTANTYGQPGGLAPSAGTMPSSATWPSATPTSAPGFPTSTPPSMAPAVGGSRTLTTVPPAVTAPPAAATMPPSTPGLPQIPNNIGPNVGGLANP